MTSGARFLTFAAVLAAAALAAPAMAAATYYASPSGGGVECTQGVPCSLTEAVSKAANGDSVVLLPGTYTLSSGLQITRSISFGGESETNTTIQTSGSASIEVNETSTATLHDFRLASTEGNLDLKSGTAERVFVDHTGANSACSMDPGASLLDSVCWSHGASPLAQAIFTEDAKAGKGTVTLRNVTAIAANPEGVGIFAEIEEPEANFTIAATNVIARGGGRDVTVENITSATSNIAAVMRNSSYATVREFGFNATVTAPGTSGNQTAAPAFVAAATGNFAEASGSPTIDKGLTEAANGATALAGEARALPGVCNGPPLTDIGAYEFVLTGCTAPTPVAVQPKPSNKVTVGKLKRNVRKGTGTLPVSVLDAGTLVLTGKGIKKVSLHSSGAAKLKLPIKPVGKAKRQLARTGAAKLKLKLSFTPVGGSVRTVSWSAKLIEG